MDKLAEMVAQNGPVFAEEVLREAVWMYNFYATVAFITAGIGLLTICISLYLLVQYHTNHNDGGVLVTMLSAFLGLMIFVVGIGVGIDYTGRALAPRAALIYSMAR